MTTSLAKQWQEAKQRHQGMILLFRHAGMGGYLAFNEDAPIVSRASASTQQVMDVFDFNSTVFFATDHLESILRALLRQGHRVAICEEAK